MTGGEKLTCAELKGILSPLFFEENFFVYEEFEIFHVHLRGLIGRRLVWRQEEKYIYY